MSRSTRGVLQTDKPFTAASINRHREELVELCHNLLLAGRELDDFDFVGPFAAPFPILVIAQSLGVPVRDRGLIKDMFYQGRLANCPQR